ncbi:MAG: metal ABC transporter substrate-binding protein [Thaumarchaeota archaeon]|nr:metal ABC transporter substrate-binding protein [Candidatus Calditenuaceae archaeon]MDW8043958.1 metal ABC transporter substrate-binding protein [Nitrososphaerota archaeon]
MNARRVLLLTAVVAAVAAISVSLTLTAVMRQPESSGEREVAVSIGLLGEIVHRLTDGAVRVQVVVPPGAEVHDWEPTPKEVERVKRAVLVFHVIKTLDGWVVDLVRSAGSGARVIEVAAHPSIKVIRTDGVPDPHVWLSLRNYASMVEVIASELVKAFPDLSDRVRSRAEALKKQVMGLYNEFAPKLEKHRGKPFVTEHLAFRYLAEEFGLKNLALKGVEEEEPTAKHLLELKEEIKKHGVKVIYAEPTSRDHHTHHAHDHHAHASELVEEFAEELGLEIMFLDTMEGLTLEDALNGHGYLHVMEENLEALLKGFGS